MKHVQACLNARDDRESSFHCGRPVRWFKPVYARKRPENAFFNLREGTVKHVKAGVMKIYTPRKYGHPGVPIFT